MSDYNYEHFDEYVSRGAADAEFPAFRNLLHVGDRAPDFVAARLDGAWGFVYTRGAFYERLRRNGPRALDELKRAEEFWRDHPPG